MQNPVVYLVWWKLRSCCALTRGKASYITKFQPNCIHYLNTDELATAHTPFGAVQVDADRCSSCGLCARFCPTGALQFTQVDACFALALQPAACLACTICVVACPENVVSLSDTVSLAAILTDEVTPLVMGELVPCAGCGVLTVHRADDPAPRCHVCRQAVGVVTAQRDEAGLMADFLKRAPKSGDQR